MLREKKKIEGLLKDYNFIDVTWAAVNERLEEDELLKIIPEYDGIICGDDRFTHSVYEKARNLKVIVKWGTGIDSLNEEEAKKRGIPIYRTPDAFTEPVADTTLALILAFCRNVVKNDNILKNEGWDKPQGYALFEKTVGIIGLGNIGQAVAKRLSAFGADILANDIVEIDSGIINKYNVTMVPKEEILETSDFITLHCELNSTSFHILTQDSFNRIKKKPYIINTARGPLIEESSLINALESGTVSGAGLDVFEDEPLPVNSPLRSMENVLLSSHNSNSSPARWGHVHKNSLDMLVKGLTS